MPLVYYCAGKKRHVCDYESEIPWRGRCPECGRNYDRLVKGNPEEKSRSSLAVIGLQEKKYIHSGMPEFDTVIGGGFVAGAPYIISGEPGCGKSTLLLTICNLFATEKKPVLYASGEERREDIGALAQRIGTLSEHVDVVGNQGDIYEITKRAEEMKAKLVVLDSLNVAYCDDVEASEGSAGQMKAVANYFTAWCKREEIPAIIIAHINAAGDLSGPKSVLHLVDTELELDKAEKIDEDGDIDPDTKGLVRLMSGKNRHGASGLFHLFRVSATGIVPVRKKSKLELV